MRTTEIAVPFGRGKLEASIATGRLNGVFVSGVNEYRPPAGENELVSAALDAPIGSLSVEELATVARRAVVIASDHTRPVPSKIIFPELLRRLRRANPALELTILIATGCHRETTRAELVGKFGEEIVDREKIVVHDGRDEAALVSLGRLPSGAELRVNRLAAETDLLLSEGFIEPHFFAGFSGGRKSVLPGIAAVKTVLGNHCAQFIASPYARAGVLENNPLHRDMVFAARAARLNFIVNVVINAEKQVIHAVAGDPVEAHLAGCAWLKQLCGVRVPESDIVITSNGGYPLDQNIYQSVKGMSTAETVCRSGGVIIMAAACSDGHGGESFHRQLREASSPAELLRQIEAVPQDRTVPDQWEVQILARILSRHKVIMVCDPAQAALVREMGMEFAADLPSALELADRMTAPNARIAVLPDGVSVIAEKI